MDFSRLLERKHTSKHYFTKYDIDVLLKAKTDWKEQLRALIENLSEYELSGINKLKC